MIIAGNSITCDQTDETRETAIMRRQAEADATVTLTLVRTKSKSWNWRSGSRVTHTETRSANDEDGETLGRDGKTAAVIEGI